MNKTLAILAAGMGSRYGGLKQLDTIDPQSHSIIDFSIYDAIQAGFNDIVFIIREELHTPFIDRFSHLDSDKVKVSYVFQEILDVPDGFTSATREKPWGTGQALLALRHTIKNNFAIINADDFYGRDAFQVIHDALFNSEEVDTYFMIGYKLKNTLSPFGTVSRGQCFVNETNLLQEVIERTQIERKNGVIFNSEENKDLIILNEDTLISMNFWGFTPSIFKYGKSIFREFLEINHKNLKSEFYVPSIVNILVKNKTIPVKVLSTDSKWFGITYKEDKEQVINAIKTMKSSKIYPEILWKSDNIKEVFNRFKHKESYKNHFALTNGHINDTYKIETTSGNDFVLQKVNTSIFTNVQELIKNKVAVSHYLKGHTNYSVSDFVKASSGDYFILDAKGNSWTLCNFIKGTKVFTVPESKDIVKEAGKLLGDFHISLEGYDVESLFETIRDFHNLSFRKKQFEEALKNADSNIIDSAQNEINLLKQFKSAAEYIDKLKTARQIPIRVVHNDAKLSNMLFDQTSQKAIALIDFDTIMPGIIHYDIGDAIRSICSVAEEDEKNLTKVLFDIDNYKVFMQGFLPRIKSTLTEIEKETISLSINYMLYEQSIRFLTDYLNGNIYYKVDYPEHNLVRARNQLRLLQIIDNQLEKIKSITRNILNA